VDPHEPMVAAREREDAGEPKERIGLGWPEAPGIEDPDVAARQDAVSPQVPGRAVGGLGRVVTRVAPMRRVRAALADAGLDRCLAVRRHRGVHEPPRHAVRLCSG